MKPTPELLKLLEQGRKELANSLEQKRLEEEISLRALQNAIDAANLDWLTTVRQCIDPALANYIVVPDDNPFERTQNEHGKRRADIAIDGLAPIKAILSRSSQTGTWKLEGYNVAGAYMNGNAITWSHNLSSSVFFQTLPPALAIAEERFAEFKAAKEKS